MVSYQQQDNRYGSLPTVENDDEVVIMEGERPTMLQKMTHHKYAVFLTLVAVMGVVFLPHQSNTTNARAPAIGSEVNVEMLGKSRKPKLLEHQIPHYYNDQLVDHFSDDTTTNTTWSARYYTSSKYWKGPGYPIFVTCGGEGPISEVFYPFVYEQMAQEFGAFVLQTEHRFYGTSVPTKAGADVLPTADEFERLLSPDQALADYARLTRHFQKELGCSTDRTDPNYCPIISVGASYPGFLSAMFRFLYPDIVDMSYASSAPLHLYAQTMGNDVYFDYVTKIAEEASPGCAHATKSNLLSIRDAIRNQSIKKTVKQLNICEKNFPKYITSPDILATELTMMVGFASADFNMDYHPPGDPTTDVIKSCQAFQQQQDEAISRTPMERMADWLVVKANSLATYKPNEPCYDLNWDIPSGRNALITGADWSGMGDGDTANTWEFQCCKDLIIETGFGPNSMLLERPFDIDWLTEHCQARFPGVIPEPTRMVDKWHFDKLVENGASHILFTNGLQDGWSALSHQEDVSDTILAINMPSGAHHSDLNEYGCEMKKDGTYSCPKELDDIKQGRKDVQRILKGWIANVKALSES